MKPRTMSELWRRTLVLIAALAVFATACGGGSDSATATPDEVLDAAAEPTEAPAATAEPEPTEPPAATSDDPDDSAMEDSPAFDANAELLRGQFRPIEPGAYRIDTLGTPFSATFPDGWFVQPNADAFVAFSHPDSMGPGDRDIAILRPNALADAHQPFATADEQAGEPVDTDINDWLSRLPDDILASGPEQTTLGGADAVTFEVEVDPSLCGLEFCIGFATNRLINSLAWEPGIRYRVYWVDQGDEAPIAISIGRHDEGFGQMIDDLLASMVFGDPQPDPIDVPDGAPVWEYGFNGEVPEGVQRFPAIGGLEIELDQERFVPQIGDWVVVTDGPIPADVEIWRAAADTNGNAIDSTDDLVAVLESLEAGVTLTERGAAGTGLGLARVFDLVTANPDDRDGAEAVSTIQIGRAHV